MSSSYSRPRSARKRSTILASVSGDDSGTATTKTFPPCERTVSCICLKKRACAAVYGSAQAPLRIPAAPMVRSRRHSATRALDGEPGSWARKSSQPEEVLSAAIYL
jgi:hypothetical protein